MATHYRLFQEIAQIWPNLHVIYYDKAQAAHALGRLDHIECDGKALSDYVAEYDHDVSFVGAIDPDFLLAFLDDRTRDRYAKRIEAFAAGLLNDWEQLVSDCPPPADNEPIDRRTDEEIDQDIADETGSEESDDEEELDTDDDDAGSLNSFIDNRSEVSVRSASDDEDEASMVSTDNESTDVAESESESESEAETQAEAEEEEQPRVYYHKGCKATVLGNTERGFLVQVEERPAKRRRIESEEDEAETETETESESESD